MSPPSILPSDEELFARTKRWAELFTKYSIEEDESAGLRVDEIGVDEEELENDDESQESVSVSKFVDVEEKEADPDFDVKEVFNETMKAVAERKQKWRNTGVDKLLDSFCKEKYVEKVDDWLNRNAGHFCKESRYYKSRTELPRIDEIEIEDHRTYVEREYSADSDESVDTIKYILSNKKKQRTRYKTMTIKRYCYSRSRRDEMEKKITMRYSEASPIFEGKRKAMFPPFNDSFHTPKCRQCYMSEPTKYKYKKRQKLKVPSSSSSDSSFSPSFRSCAGRFQRSKESNKYGNNSSSIDPNGTQNSEIRFCPENVINSTALSSKLPNRTSLNGFDSLAEGNESTSANKDSKMENKRKIPNNKSSSLRNKLKDLDPLSEDNKSPSSSSLIDVPRNKKFSYSVDKNKRDPKSAKIFAKNKDLSHEFQKSNFSNRTKLNELDILAEGNESTTDNDSKIQNKRKTSNNKSASTLTGDAKSKTFPDSSHNNKIDQKRAKNKDLSDELQKPKLRNRTRLNDLDSSSESNEPTSREKDSKIQNKTKPSTNKPLSLRNKIKEFDPFSEGSGSNTETDSKILNKRKISDNKSVYSLTSADNNKIDLKRAKHFTKSTKTYNVSTSSNQGETQNSESRFCSKNVNSTVPSTKLSTNTKLNELEPLAKGNESTSADKGKISNKKSSSLLSYNTGAKNKTCPNSTNNNKMDLEEAKIFTRNKNLTSREFQITTMVLSSDSDEDILDKLGSKKSLNE